MLWSLPFPMTLEYVYEQYHGKFRKSQWTVKMHNICQNIRIAEGSTCSDKDTSKLNKSTFEIWIYF